MEWAVVRLNGARNLVRTLAGANGAEHVRKIGRSESLTAPVEMSLQNLGDRH